MEQYRSKKRCEIKDERLDDIIKEANLALSVDMDKNIRSTI
ncbi:hypothetical protein [Clostridium kluyveri]|nr:hypothetical protein [Clostridium kluyveri]